MIHYTMQPPILPRPWWRRCLGTRYVPALLVIVCLLLFYLAMLTVTGMEQTAIFNAMMRERGGEAKPRGSPPPLRPAAVSPVWAPQVPCPECPTCPESTWRLECLPAPPDPIRDSMYTRVARERVAELKCHHHHHNRTRSLECLHPRDPRTFYSSGVERELALGEPEIIPLVAHHLQEATEDDDVVEFGALSGQYGHYFHLHGYTGNYTAFDEAINVESFTHGYVLYANYTARPITFPATWVLAPLSTPERILIPQYLDNLVSSARTGLVMGASPAYTTNVTKYIMDEMEMRGMFYDDESSVFIGTADRVRDVSWLVFTRLPHVE